MDRLNLADSFGVWPSLSPHGEIRHGIRIEPAQHEC
jgi:hypothetical protein